MALVGIRGATPLKDELELQALLATLLRLENVGLLLGAGASVAAGGKTMAGLWYDFVDTSVEQAQWLADQGAKERPLWLRSSTSRGALVRGAWRTLCAAGSQYPA